MIAPGEIENSVLAGYDGYLFLAGGSHKVFDIITGKCEIPALAHEVFTANLRGRTAWAAARGVAYAHLIMPDKQSIIPQSWPLTPPPIRIGARFVERNAAFAEAMIYPLEALAVAPERTLARVDTHLRDHGSIIVAALLAARFTGREAAALRDQLIGSIRKSEKPAPGDLGAKLTPPVDDFSEMAMLPPPGPQFSNNIAGSNNGLVDLRFNPGAPHQKRVALFGDSFGRQVTRFLHYWFSEVFFFRTGHFHEEIAALCQPDIIITENVERYLDSPLADEARPHFLLYPLLQGQSYAPPKQFAEALSAVLSFPRRPYKDFITALLPQAPKPAHEPPAEAGVPRYDGLKLKDAPHDSGLIAILEAAELVPQLLPALVVDLSGRSLTVKQHKDQQIHGSYLVRRENVLLIGANHLVDVEGAWSCEARSFKGQFLAMLKWPAYEANFPGPKPLIDDGVLSTAGLTDDQVERIEAPVFLATPLEPDNWGRWLATVAPKAVQYRVYGAGRKFFCRVKKPWQRAFLNLWGISDEMILPHDPGRTYICRDVMTVEYSVVNMTISRAERTMFFEMVVRHRERAPGPEKLFISRRSRSKKAPNYRVLQNEDDLAAALEAQGFVTVEPENLALQQQISLFSGASQIVALGGAAIYNAVFCGPGTSFLTIESSDTFVHAHTNLLSSLDLRYGVVFGRQDADDPAPVHKKWSLDINQAVHAIDRFSAN